MEVQYQKREQFFLPYFKHRNVTITVVAGDSFSKVAPRHSNEVFIVRDDWYPHDPETTIRALHQQQPSDRNRIYYLSNTEEIHRLRLAYGFRSFFVNVGFFVDASIFKPGFLRGEKKYDAVMNGRFTLAENGLELKRHFLTAKIRSLALLDPVTKSNSEVYKRKYCERGNCHYYNTFRIRPRQVAKILQQSQAGLILSEVEGICRASSEYLLAGIPVVSTPSRGGRDVWYDDYNSIIVEPNEDAVFAAVEQLKANPRDPRKIRNDYLARALVFRERYKHEVLQSILTEHNVDLDPEKLVRRPFPWFSQRPFAKTRKFLLRYRKLTREYVRRLNQSV